MRRHLCVFMAELRRSLIRLRRYPVETATNLIVSYVMFLAMASGLKALGRGHPEEIAATLVGYSIWVFASLVLVGAVAPLIQEMSIGILEQVYLSAVRPLTIVTYRTVVAIAIEGAQSLALFLFIALTLRIPLNLPPAAALPLLVIFALVGAGLFGFGLALAGLAVIYKQLGRTLQLLQLALLFLTGAFIPLETLPPPIQAIGAWLPTSLGIRAARLVVIEGADFWDLTRSGIIAAIALNTAVYLCLGILVFLTTDRAARQQGLLGQY